MSCLPPAELLKDTDQRAELNDSGICMAWTRLADIRGYIWFAVVDLERGVRETRRTTIAELRAAMNKLWQDEDQLAAFNADMDKILAELQARVRVEKKSSAPGSDDDGPKAA